MRLLQSEEKVYEVRQAITEEKKERSNFSIRLNLEGDDKNTFSPGEAIRGKITIENFKKLPKIRKIQTILGTIEFAQAQMKKKRTEIFPKYEQQTIKWNEGNNSSVFHFRCIFQKR